MKVLMCVFADSAASGGEAATTSARNGEREGGLLRACLFPPCPGTDGPYSSTAEGYAGRQGSWGAVSCGDAAVFAGGDQQSRVCVVWRGFD